MKLRGYCNRHNVPLEGSLEVVPTDLPDSSDYLIERWWVADTSNMRCPSDESSGLHACNDRWSIQTLYGDAPPPAPPSQHDNRLRVAVGDLVRSSGDIRPKWGRVFEKHPDHVTVRVANIEEHWSYGVIEEVRKP